MTQKSTLRSDSERADRIQEALHEHEGRLVRYAQRIVGDLGLAQEIVQEVFLRLCRADLDSIESRLLPWLLRVCRNLAIDALRREGTMNQHSHSQASQTIDPAKSPDQHAEEQDTHRHLMQLIDQLPSQQQEVLRLKFQNGLSYKEIANVTQFSVTNVGVLLHTAITKIRQRLATGDGEPAR